jgi:hypothetical protein
VKKKTKSAGKKAKDVKEVHENTENSPKKEERDRRNTFKRCLDGCEEHKKHRSLKYGGPKNRWKSVQCLSTLT